jgi:hypothetical protein
LILPVLYRKQKKDAIPLPFFAEKYLPGGTIGNARRLRFGHRQRKNYFYFGFRKVCGLFGIPFSRKGVVTGSGSFKIYFCILESL